MNVSVECKACKKSTDVLYVPPKVVFECKGCGAKNTVKMQMQLSPVNTDADKEIKRKNAKRLVCCGLCVLCNCLWYCICGNSEGMDANLEVLEATQRMTETA